MNLFVGGTLPDGLAGLAVIVLCALAAHEVWRWAGLWLGADLDVDGEAFRWVRLVSTALVAGLVLRLVVDPAAASPTCQRPSGTQLL